MPTGQISGVTYTHAPRTQIFLFGDSITQYASKSVGWGALLADAYTATCRSADIVNRGFAGYNTRWALLVLPQLIAQLGATPPAVATIFFGANDACLEGTRQHIPLDEYDENLCKIVSMMREAWRDVKIILIGPPPIDAEKWDAKRGGPGMGERTQDQAQKYAKRCKEVAARLQCPCVDSYTSFLEDKEWKEHLDDGLHFSPSDNATARTWPELTYRMAGNTKLATLLSKVIEEEWPGLTPTGLPAHMPINADLTPDNYKSLLNPPTDT